MPEGPEVFQVQQQLSKSGAVNRIMTVEGRFTERLRIPIPDLTPVNKARLVKVNRSGKVLGLKFDNGLTLVSHLGMTGAWNIHKGLRPPPRDWRGGHHHVVLRFSGPTRAEDMRLIYTDARRFGALQIMDDEQVRAMLASMGLNLLKTNDHMNLRALLEKAGQKKTIKAFLMDYRQVLDIGNIYANEILHRARIHPATYARECVAHSQKLLTLAQTVLGQAMLLGGSTIHTYRQPDGGAGTMQEHYTAYGRPAGAKCSACKKGVMVRAAFVGDRRTSYVCPVCQPAPEYAVEVTDVDD